MKHLPIFAIIMIFAAIIIVGVIDKEDSDIGATKRAGLFTYRLSGAGISSSATSFTLNSLTLPQNDYPVQDTDLSDTFFITLEPGSTSRQEFVSCTTVGANTGSSVAISGCTRGLSPLFPYTASTTLRFAHSGGSAVIFSDSPNFYEDFVAKQNEATITGQVTIASTTIDVLKFFMTTSTSEYLWANKVTGQMGWATNSAEYAFNTGGTSFSTVDPLTLTSGELKLATSTYDFRLEGTVLRIATSSITSGTASGNGWDDQFNIRWNSTTTIPVLTISGAATTTSLVVGTNPSGNTGTLGLYVSGNATTTGSIDVETLCFSGANCTTGVSTMATSTADSRGDNTLAPYAIQTYTIPAGSASAGDAFRVTAFGLYNESTGSRGTVAIKFNAATTTECDIIDAADEFFADSLIVFGEGTIASGSGSCIGTQTNVIDDSVKSFASTTVDYTTEDKVIEIWTYVENTNDSVDVHGFSVVKIKQ